jgi:hypothetical protein
MCEETYSVGLIKGNYGKPLSLSEYDQTIKGYIQNNPRSNSGFITIFLNNPDNSNGCYINLNYYDQPVQGIPAKHFKYEIPRTTTAILRTSKEIFDQYRIAFLQTRTNVFYYNLNPIEKVFPQNKLRETIEKLIKVNNVFMSYGAQYQILGGVYAEKQENTLERLATSFGKAKESWKNLPADVSSWWNNL